MTIKRYATACNDLISYPEVYLPAGLDKIYNAVPPIDGKLKKPFKPSQPIKPIEPKFSFLILAQYLCVFLLYCIPFLLFALMVTHPALITLLIFVIPVSFPLVSLIADKFQKNINEYRSHRKAMSLYRKNMIDYKRKLAQYFVDLNWYESNKNFIDAKIKKARSPRNTLLYRQKLLAKRFGNPTDKFTVNYNLNVKEGYAEDTFFRYLRNRFTDDNWHLQKYAEAKAASLTYYPDILITYNHIVIDVEIDEPYAFDDGKPIHYQYHDGTIFRSIDEPRNQFFTSKNWIVIRFSEEQIITQPQQCYQLICDIAKAVDSCKDIPNLSNSFNTVKKWTKSEAELMAESQYRDLYIPNRR